MSYQQKEKIFKASKAEWDHRVVYRKEDQGPSSMDSNIKSWGEVEDKQGNWEGAVTEVRRKPRVYGNLEVKEKSVGNHLCQMPLMGQVVWKQDIDCILQYGGHW